MTNRTSILTKYSMKNIYPDQIFNEKVKILPIPGPQCKPGPERLAWPTVDGGAQPSVYKVYLDAK